MIPHTFELLKWFSCLPWKIGHKRFSDNNIISPKLIASDLFVFRFLWDCFWGMVLIQTYFWSNYSDPKTRPISPKGWWKVRETPLFQGNLGWWNIMIWPDIYRVDFPQQPLGGHGSPRWGCVSRCHEWWPDQPAVPVFRFLLSDSVEAGKSERSSNLSRFTILCWKSFRNHK